MSENYTLPVSKLLTYGTPPLEPIPNYLELGFTHDDVPELIRLATDRQLYVVKDSDAPEGWAPVHAWRTLQQLHAEEALIPLTVLFEFEDDDAISFNGMSEWLIEELPVLYASFGSAAIPTLDAYINDLTHQAEFGVSSAASALAKIATEHPEYRSQCIDSIARRLAQFAQSDASLNAWLVSALSDIKAVEAAAVIEQAFAADAVDMSIVGDWDDAKVALGLMRPEDLPPRPRFQPAFPEFFSKRDSEEDFSTFTWRDKSLEKAKKAKRKQEKKSRKLNRKKKKK